MNLKTADLNWEPFVNLGKQSQFELFPMNGSGRPLEPPKPRFFLKSLTLSLETLVVVGIIAMMGLVVSYSLGIEKGKRSQVATARTRPPAAVPAKLPAVGRPIPQVAPSIKNTKEIKPVAIPAAAPAANSDATRASVSQSRDLILSKPADAPVSIASVIEKLYTIQIASYKHEKDAQREASLLKQKGYDILVLPKGSFSIVCVGKFNQKEQAKNFSQKLKKQYKDLLVRSL